MGLRSESIPPLEQTGDARFRDFGRKGRFFGSRDFGGHFPVVVVPYGYADYGRYYTEPNIIVIDAGTRTESSTEYVVAVPPREPANPKLLELEPTEPKSQEATEEAEAVEAIEMVRPGQEAVAPTAPEEKPKPLIYLIALKSGVIHAARKHWLQNQALHYVTIQDEQKSAPLEEVDFDFTGQLNKERGVSFVVPVEIRSEEEKPEPEQKPEEEPEEEPVEK